MLRSLKQYMSLLLIVSFVISATALIVSATDKTDSLSDVSNIISNSYVVCVNSPISFANGTKQEITINQLPYFSASTVMLAFELTSLRVGVQYSTNGQGGFNLSANGFNIVGAVGIANVTVNGVNYTLSATPQMKNGYLFVPASIFSLIQKNVFQGTTGLVTIGTVAVNTSNEARLLGLMGVYVSKNGSDLNPGTPMLPVATIQKARDIVRNIKTVTGISSYGVTVYIHSGEYRFSSKLELTATDSGLTNAPVSYRRFGDGDVSIRGSIDLNPTQFSVVTDSTILSKIPAMARGKVMEIQLPFTAQGYTPPSSSYSVDASYYELYSNKKLQTLSRWPNGEYKLTGTILDAGLTTGKPKFNFTDSEPLKWVNSKYALFMGYWGNDWSCQPLPFYSLDTTQKSITMSRTPTYTILKGVRYYAFNLIEELDIPGEWYIDKETSKLYYYPTADFATSDLELSTLDTELIYANGVSNLNFEGLNIEYNRGIGISFNACSNCLVTGSNIKGIGQMAIKIDNCTYTSIKSSEISDIGGIGVYLNGGTRVTLVRGDNSVENCHIYNFGRLYKTYAGAIDIFGVGQLVSHNVIHDNPHLAIRFNGNDHIIEYNEIYNSVRETKDAGAIYCGRDWTTRGNEIRYNYIHDIDSSMSTGSGTDAEAIYLDDAYSDVKVFGNVIARVNRASLIGGGRDNKFSNNIIINSDKGLYYDERVKYGQWGHAGTLPNGALYNNLMSIINNASYNSALWASRYPTFPALVTEVQQQAADPYNSAKDAGLPKGVEIANNVFCGPSALLPSYKSIAASVSTYGTIAGNWYTTTSDVGFVNANVQNYALNANSSVYANVPNFQPIPFSNIGMYTDQWRTGIVTPSLDTAAVFPPDISNVDSDGLELVWMKSDGVDSYQLTLSRNADLSSPIISTTVMDNRYKPTSLAQGTYYWQVKAINNSNTIGGSRLSNVFSFTVNNSINLDFNDMPDKTLVEHIPGFQVSYTNKSINDTAEISGGAIKLTKSSTSGSIIALTYNNPLTETGQIVVEYKVRFENNSQGTDKFPSINGVKGVTTLADVHKATVTSSTYKSLYGTASYATMASSVNTQATKWYSVKYVTDTTSDKFDVYVDGKLLSGATSLALSKDIDYLGALNFNLSTTTVGGAVGIYWIDDIKIYKVVGVQPLSFATPANKLKNVARTGSFSVDFTGELDTATINSTNVTLTHNNIPANILVSTRTVNGVYRKIQVDTNATLDGWANYVLKLSTNIKSKDGVKLDKEYTYEFSTITPVSISIMPTLVDTNNNPIDTLIPSQNVKALFPLNNTSPTQALPLNIVVALKDLNGVLKKIILANQTIPANGSSEVQIPFTLPTETLSSWRVWLYVWDSANNVTPLYNGKVQLP